MPTPNSQLLTPNFSRRDCEARVAKLSAQMREVLRRKAAGLANKQIADELNLTENTVRIYMERTYSRLQVNSIALATRVAVMGGLV